MRTYPLNSDNGERFGFEINHTWIWIGSIVRILRSVPGVSEVRRVRGGAERIKFLLDHEKFVILEPYGDSSRYWIVPEGPSESTADQTKLHHAFAAYRNPLVRYVSGIFGRSTV